MLTIGLTAYARREHAFLGCFFDYHQESKQQVVAYTMSDFEGIPRQQPFDESPVPATDENAESPLNASLSAASTENAELCPCKKAYEESGNEKKVLYLMSIGLQCNDVPLFSFETLPWSLLPKTSLRPKNTDYGKEIARRATLFKISPAPRPSNWTRQQTIEWLQQNPVRENADIDFLTKEVARVRDVLVRAQQQQETSDLLAACSSNLPSNIGGRSWRGNVPYLRVIMCLTQDRVKSLFLTRANIPTRQELDARRNESR